MNLYEIIDHFIYHKKKYIYFFLLYLIIALPTFFYFKLAEENKLRYYTADYVFSLTNETKKHLADIYTPIRNESLLVISLFDDNQIPNTEQEWLMREIYHNEVLDVDLTKKYNELVLLFLKTFTSSENFNRQFQSAFKQELNVNLIDKEYRIEKINELYSRTDMLSTNPDFNQTFETMYNAAILNGYIQIKIDLFDFLLPKHKKFIIELLIDAQKEVKNQIVNDSRRLYNDYLTQQEIKIKNLQNKSQALGSDYLRNLKKRKEYLHERFAIAKSLGIVGVEVIHSFDSKSKDEDYSIIDPIYDTLFMGTDVIQLKINSIEKLIKLYEDGKEFEYGEKGKIDETIKLYEEQLIRSKEDLEKLLNDINEAEFTFFEFDSGNYEEIKNYGIISLILNFFAVMIFLLMLLFFLLIISDGYKKHGTT